MQELVNKVWGNKKFHNTAKAIERAWLRRELNLSNDLLDENNAASAMASAAILACSTDTEHREAALRLSTYVYELSHGDNTAFSSALRVVLTRLGNFPSIGMREPIKNALHNLPHILAVEDIETRTAHTIQVDDQDVTLTPFQRSLWRKLAKNSSVAFSAPTSGGKSFVLELYLSSLFDGRKRCLVYIVPTRALISQVARELAILFYKNSIRPEIITVPIDADTSIPNQSILVMTQERADLILQTHQELVADVIVVDEAHSISEGARGILLQSVIDKLLLRKPDAQILFATPITKNLETFGRTFKRPDIIPQFSKEPTVAQNFLIVDVKAARSGKMAISVTRPSRGSSSLLGEITPNIDIRTRIERLAKIPTVLCPGQSNLIYANGASEAEEIALLIAETLPNQPPSNRQKALSKLAKETVHSKYILAQCVEKGVGFHYANIPTNLRQEIESAFDEGHLKYLVCTSTLLQGINLPAKNLFLLKPTRGQATPLESQDFWNLAGRAGRMMREFQGNIFLIDYEQWPTNPLRGARDAEIAPAIEKSIKLSSGLLRATIAGKSIKTSNTKKAELETAFVRLFSAFKKDQIDDLLSRLELEMDEKTELKKLIAEADVSISLPATIIEKNHNVSVHRQERLYVSLKERISTSTNDADILSLIPPAPNQRSSFQSYADILELCHKVILGIDTTRNLHRFHALLALRWMSGWSIPRIVSAVIKRQRDLEAKKSPELRKDIDTRKIIRDTLETIEEAIRFQTIRLFGCYRTILEHALRENGKAAAIKQMSNVELFLEIGASTKTIVSLISLGISRSVAIKLDGARSELDPPLDREEAMSWLRENSDNLLSLGLSELQIAEVRRIINS